MIHEIKRSLFSKFIVNSDKDCVKNISTTFLLQAYNIFGPSAVVDMASLTLGKRRGGYGEEQQREKYCNGCLQQNFK